MLAEGRIDCVLYPMGASCAQLDVSPYFMVGELPSNHGFFRPLRKCLETRPTIRSRKKTTNSEPRLARMTRI